MKRRIAVLTVLLLLLASGITDPTYAFSGGYEGVDRVEQESVVSELERLNERDYRAEYTLIVNDTETQTATFLVSNSKLRFHTRQRRTQPLELYGNPVARWAKHNGKWHMQTRDSETVGIFTPDRLDATDLVIQSNTESTAVLELNDSATVRAFVSGSPRGWAPDAERSRVRIRFDKTDRRVTRVTHYTVHEDWTESTAIYEFSRYGTVSVERPDDVPFSLHEQLRLLLYKLGLI